MRWHGRHVAAGAILPDVRSRVPRHRPPRACRWLAGRETLRNGPALPRPAGATAGYRAERISAVCVMRCLRIAGAWTLRRITAASRARRLGGQACSGHRLLAALQSARAAAPSKIKKPEVEPGVHRRTGASIETAEGPLALVRCQPCRTRADLLAAVSLAAARARRTHSDRKAHRGGAATCVESPRD